MSPGLGRPHGTLCPRRPELLLYFIMSDSKEDPERFLNYSSVSRVHRIAIDFINDDY